jgi:prevent-host-death family protein
MKKRSLADAKAHLSALVDEAEHKGRRVLILRHGRPSAAIVPVDVALAPAPPPGRRGRRRLSAREVRALLGSFGRSRPVHGAVKDLLDNRR